MRLSEHFNLSEFVRSDLAESKKIENVPDLKTIWNLMRLCKFILEPARKAFGPINISSGYRCDELNKLVGGAINSQHKTGCAADLTCKSDKDLIALYELIKLQSNYDQLILERHWVHVSYANKPRLSCLINRRK